LFMPDAAGFTTLKEFRLATENGNFTLDVFMIVDIGEYDRYTFCGGE
jgi:hypothetical protein